MKPSAKKEPHTAKLPEGEKGRQDLRYPSPFLRLEMLPKDLFLIVLPYPRCQRCLTQAEVAAELGMTQQVYGRLERPGQANPTLATVRRIEQALGVDQLTLM